MRRTNKIVCFRHVLQATHGNTSGGKAFGPGKAASALGGSESMIDEVRAIAKTSGAKLEDAVRASCVMHTHNTACAIDSHVCDTRKQTTKHARHTRTQTEHA